MTAPFARRDAGDLATTVRLGWSWTLVELRLFFRVPMQAVFTFALPILFLVIFASLFSGDIDAGPGRRLSFVQYFLPGIIAAGTVSTTFANLAMSIAVQQHEGLLKRLGGTPFPRASYFIGKCSEAVIITALQTALMLTIAVLAYGADLPVSAGRWAGFVAFLLASAATGSVLGIAYTRAIPGATAGPALVQLPFLVLQFISGVFVRYNEVPGWLHGIASLFPLKWMSEGLRWAFLPDWFGEYEYGSDWGWQWPLLAVGLWLVLGTVLALVFFRWEGDSR